MEHLAVAGEEVHPDDAAGGGVLEDPEHEGREHRRGDAGRHVAERRLPRVGGRDRGPRRPGRAGEGRGERDAAGAGGVEPALVAGGGRAGDGVHLGLAFGLHTEFTRLRRAALQLIPDPAPATHCVAPGRRLERVRGSRWGTVRAGRSYRCAGALGGQPRADSPAVEVG